MPRVNIPQTSCSTKTDTRQVALPLDSLEVTRTMSLDELSVSSIPPLSTSHPFGVTVHDNIPVMIQAAMTAGASLENMSTTHLYGT